MIDILGSGFLEMIDCLFAQRRTVTDYEVLMESRRHSLGRDGERAVRFLQPGRYDEAGLKVALAEAAIDSRCARRDAGESRRLSRPA